MTTHEASDGGSAINPLMTPDSDDEGSSYSFAAVREATEEHARPLPDGGAARVRVTNSTGGSETVGQLLGSLIESMSTAQLAGAGVGSLVLLAALSGDEAEGGRGGDQKVSCPECGEKKSKRGMMGHLRWSHDLDGDEMDDAKAKAGIGQ